MITYSNQGGYMSYLRTELLKQRAYQSEIHQTLFSVEHQDQNMIVVAATSAGKTINEIMAADVYLSQSTTTQIIIITQTNALCDQLRMDVLKFLTFSEDEVLVINGAIRPEKRINLWKQARVSVTTANCMINDLNSGRLLLDSTPLVIMDEVHNARKEHAYAQVAQHLQSLGVRILGFTASAGGSVEKIHELVDTILAKEVVYLDPKDKTYTPYHKGSDENHVTVEIDDHQRKLLYILEVLFYKPVQALVDAHFMIRGQHYTQTDIDKTIKRLQVLAKLSKKSEQPLYFKLIRDSYIYLLLRYLEECILTGTYQEAWAYLEDLKNKKSKSAQAIWKEFETELIQNQLQVYLSRGFLHPKVKEFARRTKLVGMNDKTIVFVNNRQTGDYLVQFINESLGMRAKAMFGQKHMPLKTQRKVLTQFHNNEFQFLVATSVAEAGLHVPELDRVVHYHPPLNDIAYIQRSGRTGRTSRGCVDFYLINHPIEMVRFYTSKGGKKRQGSNIEKVVAENKNPTSARRQLSLDIGDIADAPRKKNPRVIKQKADTSNQLEMFPESDIPF